MPLEQRVARLGVFDVVVCATSAPSTVVPGDAVSAAMHKRPARPLFFIDLALPRDVDTRVAKLENVFLYNLDDLAKIAEENRAAREAELAKCRGLLAERAETLWRHVEPKLPSGMTGEGARPPLPNVPSSGGAVPSPRV
jgi:glutamyl-tRNA reductase